MHLSDIHWVALTTSVVIYMAVGAIWYSPLLFGETWLNALGYRPEKMKPTGKVWIGAVLNALLTTYGLAVYLHYTGVEHGIEGMKMAFFPWIGFTVPAHFAPVLWESRPFKVFLIHAGCMLVTLLLMGFVIGGF